MEIKRVKEDIKNLEQWHSRELNEQTREDILKQIKIQELLLEDLQATKNAASIEVIDYIIL